jgi:hypothetical protein
LALIDLGLARNQPAFVFTSEEIRFGIRKSFLKGQIAAWIFSIAEKVVNPQGS